MRALSIICIIGAVLSMVIGAYLRIAFIRFGPMILTGKAFFGFAATILLLAIALSLLEKK